VPLYNSERFIAQTIESALRQTYRNLEILVVDDGSTDGSRAIAQSFADTDSRVRIIQQPNSGVARARNRGLAEARGEFVAPLDADDLWDPCKIEHQVRRMQNSGGDTAMVYCWWAWIDDRGTVLDRSPSWDVEGHALEMLLQINFTGNASVPLYRRRCLEGMGGYDESLEHQGGRGCEDWDVALRIAARYQVAVARQVLVGYRRLRNSMSTQCEVMWRSQELLMKGIFECTPALSKELRRRSADQFALYLAGVLFRSGDYFRSFSWAIKAWRTGLFFRVLPYAVLVFARRILAYGRADQQVMTPGTSLRSAELPQPLIPYDRIYAARTAVCRAEDRSRRILRSGILQVFVLVLSSLFVFWLQRSNDGLWYQGDAPRHAANGYFWYDAIVARPASLTDFAVRYYARYPVINPVTYPPLFYLLEGMVFRVFGGELVAAKGLVLAFALLAGLYTMAWARRWLAPEAGWAGALLAFVPGVMIWANTIMLNVPAMALGVACLYHARRWLDSHSFRHLAVSACFGTAALLTYYQGGIAIAIVLVWGSLQGKSIPTRKRAILTLGVTSILAGLPVLLAAKMTPVFLERQLPAIKMLQKPETWSYYPVNLSTLLSPLLVVLGLAGFFFVVAKAEWRVELKFLASWILTPVVVFSILPAKDTRYILIVAPAFVLAAAIALVWVDRLLLARSPFGRIAALLVGLAVCGWSATLLHIPKKSGFIDVVQYLSLHAPHDAFLYDGYHDGLIGFYARALDPQYERRLMLGQELLYRYGPGSNFNWFETKNAGSVQEVEDLLRYHSGCTWIAIERGPSSEWADGQRLLRKALAGPHFELVRSFAVSAPNAQRIDLYRMRGPVTPVSTVDVRITSFSHRTFRHVIPISH
jgi:glycosyltransferase involved in cell wall biosynthesis